MTPASPHLSSWLFWECITCFPFPPTERLALHWRWKSCLYWVGYCHKINILAAQICFFFTSAQIHSELHILCRTAHQQSPGIKLEARINSPAVQVSSAHSEWLPTNNIQELGTVTRRRGNGRKWLIYWAASQTARASTCSVSPYHTRASLWWQSIATDRRTPVVVLQSLITPCACA